MNEAQEHYKNQLAAIYTWMAGGAHAAIERNRAMFRQLGADNWLKGTAIDLGAGSGFQSVPLAEIGYSVIAVDFSPELLSELKDNAKDLDVEIIQDDILHFRRHRQSQVELIVCMGDTLTHLESPDAVEKLLADIAVALVPGGKAVLTFRNYTSKEPEGVQRFIPVRSDDTRVHTCYLEYHPDKVEVYDLLYTKDEKQQWQMSISSYPKLRLSPDEVASDLKRVGLHILRHEMINGMAVIVAEKAK